MAERKRVTLSDGTVVVLRRLGVVDQWDLAKVEDDIERSLKALSLAIAAPRVLIEGLPAAEPVPDTLHVREISDGDYGLLMTEVRDFALGGARQAQFPAGTRREGIKAPGSAGAEVREASDGDRGASAGRV